MLGGTVTDVMRGTARVWVSVKDDHSTETCGLYLAVTDSSVSIHKGDRLWWQGNVVMWTRLAYRVLTEEQIRKKGLRCGIDYDVEIPIESVTSSQHPAQILIDRAYPGQ